MDANYNLGALSPQEKDELLLELLRKNGEPVASSEPQGDASYNEICQLLEMLIDKVEEIDDRSSKLEKAVIDDLFGGIERMYNDNLKTKGIGEIKERYGQLFEPHMDIFKQSDPDMDIFEELHNQREEMRGGEGYSDEGFDEKVQGYAKAVAEKIEQLKADGTIPPGAEVEVKIDNVEQEELSPAQKLVRGVKEKNKAMGRDYKQI